MEMDTDTSTEMLALKSAWLNLSAEVRHLATGCIDSKRPLDFGSASDTATTANPSLTSPQSTYSITNESCVSPTTCSQSSFLSDESQVDFDDMAARIEKELQQILEEATQLDLAVDDPVAIRAVVDHQQQVWYFVTKIVLTKCEKKCIQIVKGQNNFWYKNAFLTCSWRFL